MVDLQAVRLSRHPKSVRLMPELDGIEALYDLGPSIEQLIARPVIGWSLSEEGKVAGLIAYNGELVRSDQITSNFKGYFDPITGMVDREPPTFAEQALTASWQYFSARTNDRHLVIPESMGHRVAMYTSLGWQFKSVVGWRLNNDGDIAPLIEQSSTMTDPPMIRRLDARKMRGYAGLVDAHQAQQLDAGGPVEVRFIGLRKIYLT